MSMNLDFLSIPFQLPVDMLHNKWYMACFLFLSKLVITTEKLLDGQGLDSRHKHFRRRTLFVIFFFPSSSSSSSLNSSPSSFIRYELNSRNNVFIDSVPKSSSSSTTATTCLVISRTASSSSPLSTPVSATGTPTTASKTTSSLKSSKNKDPRVILVSSGSLITRNSSSASLFYSIFSPESSFKFEE